MQQLLNEVKRAEKRELTRANRKHPMFASMHESYSVLTEKIEEVEHERDLLRLCFNAFFNCMKADHYKGALYYLSDIKTSAINSAVKMIQVAAMAQKAMDSIKQGNW